MSIGRKEIFTDEPFITPTNIIPIMQKAMKKFYDTQKECTFLIEYEGGKQPNTAIKTTRKDIKNFCPDNLAHKVTEFNLGFIWGFPISLVQRGERDSGKEEEAERIALLNEQYEIAKVRTKTQQLARFVEICGVGFTCVEMNTDWKEGDTFFSLNVLDPRNAFVIRSSYYMDRRVMLGCTFRVDEENTYHFTCFSGNARYELVFKSEAKNETYIHEMLWNDEDRWTGKMLRNIHETIPIVEWIRSYDRTGCFEHQIPAMNDLNKLRSNFMNEIEQATNTLWHYNDVEFPVDDKGNEINPKTGDMIRTFTSPDGKVAKIDPLVMDYNYDGLLNKIRYDRSIILEECNIPQTSENTANSSGIAMSDALGWGNAENAANKQQCIMESCKLDEVKIVQAILQNSPFVPQDSPLLELRWFDVCVNIKRQKNYEMANKINAYATGVSHGIAPQHMIREINLFSDPQQVITDSEPYFERYLDSAFKTQDSGSAADLEKEPNADRMMQDYSDQTANSPMLDKNRG